MKNRIPLLLISSFIILASCGKKQDYFALDPIGPALTANNNPTTNQIYDLEFYRYVFAQRMEISLAATNNISIALDSNLSGTSVIGVCEQAGNLKRITLNPSFWNNSIVTNEGREELILHEFGHCYLGRDHLTATVISIENPMLLVNTSIMNSYFIDPFVYKANWKAYMHELKNPGYTAQSYYGIPGRGNAINPHSEWDGAIFSAYFANLTNNSTMDSNALRTYNLQSDEVTDPFGNKVKLVNDDRYGNITDLDCD